MQNKLSILIWLNRPKASKKTGHIPVYARITIDSDYDEISVGAKVLAQYWDNRSKLAMAKSPDVDVVNSRISQVVVDLKRHFVLL
ncbi:MAG: hypothetical protein H7282_03820 [Cytophagaceae bacterium]|nr:hypothetical protein [Cytophagaceae bacterium]